MRVRIVFKLKNRGGYVPFHHQYLLAQLIRGLILSGDKTEFYNYPFYNFSGLKGQTKISRSGLHFYSNKVTLVFACLSQEFLNYVLQRVFSYEQYELGNLLLEPEFTELESKPDISESQKFICISPLVLVQPKFNDKSSSAFIPPSVNLYSDLLYENTILRLKDLKAYNENELGKFTKFEIVPDMGYLNKISENHKKFARVYTVYDNDVKYEVRGYTFPFTLYAPKEVQEFVFTCGLGLYANKGFGMLDLANSDPSQRVTLYEDYKD